MSAHRLIDPAGGRGVVPDSPPARSNIRRTTHGAVPQRRVWSAAAKAGAPFSQSGESNMKKLLLAATALSLMAAPAFAADPAPPSATTSFTGTVGASCTTFVGGPVALGALTTGQGTLNTGAVNRTFTLPGPFVCNGVGTTVTVNADPIARPGFTLPEGAAAAGFAASIDYTATISWPEASSYTSSGVYSVPNATTASSATSQVIGLARATTGSLVITGAAPAGGATNLIAGTDYAGQVVITVAALP